MPDSGGWRPLSTPQKAGAAAFDVSPFTRLARVHALSIAADTLVTVSLAGTLFFSIPTGAARGKVALYLILTIAPFALVAPLIGPAIDRIRGGRRLMVILTCVAKAGVCLLMAQHVDDLFLFPLAFSFLVLGKAYAIARTALVPTVVDRPEELVAANSRLQLLAGVAGLAVGAVAGAVVKGAGPELALVLGAIAAAAAAVLASKLSGAAVAPEPESIDEEAELRGEGIVLAAEAMGLLRGMVGFLTFLLAFDLKGGGRDSPVPVGLALGRAVRDIADFPSAGGSPGSGAPAWHFGVILVASGAGALIGALLAPRLREYVSEEKILFGSLVTVAIFSLGAAIQGGLLGPAAGALAVATGAGAGRLVFDAIVQRDAPDANFGRSFARFETRFQLVWVIGGFIPVIVAIPARLGFLVVAAAAAFAAFAYETGERRARQHRQSVEPLARTRDG